MLLDGWLETEVTPCALLAVPQALDCKLDQTPFGH
jgi:hypothetical protein